MNSQQESTSLQGIFVRQGKDRFNNPDSFGGASEVTCKVSARDTKGELYVFESTTNGHENVPRHIHAEQDEWFYVINGEFRFEVGEQKYLLAEGDCLLAPRGVPHVWLCASATGKLIIACQPAGTMEAFFHEVAALVAQGVAEEEFVNCYQKHGMQIVGPPLSAGTEKMEPVVTCRP